MSLLRPEWRLLLAWLAWPVFLAAVTFAGDGQPPASGDVAAPEPPFALDAAKPARISWPLDIGPDCAAGRPDDRICLRARQGVNEIQERGAGWALFPFRIARAGLYVAWLRVRWCSDGIGDVTCNNSWFASFDDLPAAVVGQEERRTDWFWSPGPRARLQPGIHWLRVALREDGPAMDRVAILPAEARADPVALDILAPARFRDLAGEAPPCDPQMPLGKVEFAALPTGDLAIGEGHTNEITLCASWHGGGSETGFQGTVEACCPTSGDLTVKGDRDLKVGPANPWVRTRLILGFPPQAPRRPHLVTIAVSDASGTGARRCVFQETIRFVKGPAWAFLGPFRGAAGRGSMAPPMYPCDQDPSLLAGRKGMAALGLTNAPAQGATVEWKVIDDGSCYDWTGAVDLLKVYGPSHDCFAYAVTWIQAETSLQHRSFGFQADDSAWLWMSGEFVVTLPANLPREANRLWSSARLDPGPNPVAVKISQRNGYWGFRFDVVDWHWQGRRGDVVSGLEPAGWPRRP